MVENQNAAIVDRISEDIKESNLALLPRNVNNSIQPVLITNPPAYCNIVRSIDEQGTIYTTPADKDFYLTGVWAQAWSFDAPTNCIVKVVINGETLNLMNLKGITGESVANSLSCVPPIKIDRNTAIITTIGDDTGTAGITGYTVDTLKK